MMSREERYDSKRVRLRSGEYERSDGKYEYRYSLYRKQYSVYAATLVQLREKENEITADKEACNARYKSEKTTVNDLYELWKELKRGIRDSTYCNYCYCYDRYAYPAIGEQAVVSLKRSEVKRFFNSLVDNKKLKFGTVDCVHTILHQVLQIAVDDELIQSNPSDNAFKELMRSHNIHSGKRKALSPEEQTLLMRFLSGNTAYSRWLPIFTVLLETGLRVGEITGLRWCDINLEKKMIDVNHTLVYFDKSRLKNEQGCGFAVNAAKTPASKRHIPMTKSVVRAFEAERRNQSLRIKSENL